MKTLPTQFGIVLLCLCLSISCTNEDLHQNNYFNESFNRWDDAGTVAPRYDGSDGGPIENKFARTWIENFAIKSRYKNARITSEEYFLRRNIIDQILLQPECTGVRIYYAVRDTEPVLIISGVDSNGENIRGENSVLAITQYSLSNITDSIDLPTAQEFVSNYQNQVTSDEILSHYFGRKVVDLVLSQNNCTGLRLYLGLNENGNRKILIGGTTSFSGGSSGRTMNESDLPLLMNFSFPCPSVCGNSSNRL